MVDDYHAIEDERIHEGWRLCSNICPNKLRRIVITSRMRAALGIGTLRARGQLTEIDAARLRFSRCRSRIPSQRRPRPRVARRGDRASARANGGLGGGSLPGACCRCADARTSARSSSRSRAATGGWLTISAPRCSPSCPTRRLPSCFTRACSTGFARRCATPSRGAQDSRAMLDRIERSNYFVIPLDPSHDWYRYHHLFGELLRHELEAKTTGVRGGAPPPSRSLVPRRRTCVRRDRTPDGGRRARRGIRADLDSLAVVQRTWGSERRSRGGSRPCPETTSSATARLCLARARTASVVGNRDEMLQWLDLADEAPRYNPSNDAWLGQQATVLRATAWEQLGDMRKSKELAARLAPLDGSSFWHSLAASNLGAAARWLDDDAEAVALLDPRSALNRDRIAMVSVFVLGQLALIAADQGDWRACAAHVRPDRSWSQAWPRGVWQCGLTHVAHGGDCCA